MNKQRLIAILFGVFAVWATPVIAQGTQVPTGNGAAKIVDVPLAGVSLYSSGVGYFVHRGRVSGDAAVELEFDLTSIDDVLKSLTVYDPNTQGISVTYDAEDTLSRTLQSLRVDLSGAPSLGEMLANLRGEAVSLRVPDRVEGRILGAERIQSESGETWRLSLVTPSGIRRIGLDEIESLSFSDAALSADLTRALDALSGGAGNGLRKVRLNLSGKGDREVTVAYVVPVPVWKAAYRLDLSGEKPFLQGWAIVDNAGSVDWKAVRLSLMNGKPVSFIQNLYNPFYISRPVLPLSIAGYADAKTYDSGYGNEAEYAMEDYAYAEMAAPAPAMAKSLSRSEAKAEKAPVGSSGTQATARSAGDLFEFTLPGAVTIDRRKSTMLPLVEGAVAAERLSVFSGADALSLGSVHPMLAARFTNTTGLKLPAGPVTVFDGGTYAGDALLDFLGENDARLIAYGEDTAVSGWADRSASRETVSAKISKGTMTIVRKNLTVTKYTLKNASNAARKISLEHPITSGASLAEPAGYDERTDSLYRFSFGLGAGKESSLTVREETPVSETVVLDRLKGEALLYYSTNRDLSDTVRSALSKAAEFRRRADDAQTALSDLQGRRNDFVREQERIRLNLTAAGNATQQGKEYLKRLTESDDSIARLDSEIEAARKALDAANRAFASYLSGLEL